MNVDIGTVAAQFLFWECVFQIFDIGSLQCVSFLSTTTKLTTIPQQSYTNPYLSLRYTLVIFSSFAKSST